MAANATVVPLRPAPRPASAHGGRWTGDHRMIEPVARATLALRAGHRAFGLRVIPPDHVTGADPDVLPGQLLPPSWTWRRDAWLGERAAGVHAAAFWDRPGLAEAIEWTGLYFGRQIALIGGLRALRGEIPGDRVIVEPVVLAVWRRRHAGFGRGSAAGAAGDHADHDEA